MILVDLSFLINVSDLFICILKFFFILYGVFPLFLIQNQENQRHFGAIKLN